jgi:hypothetical protein
VLPLYGVFGSLLSSDVLFLGFCAAWFAIAHRHVLPVSLEAASATKSAAASPTASPSSSPAQQYINYTTLIPGYWIILQAWQQRCTVSRMFKQAIEYKWARNRLFANSFLRRVSTSGFCA